MKYDVDYFINKFEAIPEYEWRNSADGCAYTHCGMYEKGYAYECPALSELFKTIHFKSKLQIKRDKNKETYHNCSWLVAAINDDGASNDTCYKQPTAKQRILAALYDIREIQIEEANLKATKELINQPSQLQKV